MFELTGRKALVSGASGGIGREIAAALHAQGAELALTGTRRAALDGLAAELGGAAHVMPADLAEPSAAEGLVAAAEAAMGQIDILVNNAGLIRDGLALRLKDEDWQSVIDVDLTAAFRLTRAALRGMVRRRHGRIISVTSIVAVTGNPGQANYAAAKAATDRHVEIARRRGCRPRHHGQLRRSGLYRDADDRQTGRRAARPPGCGDSVRAVRRAG